MTTAVGRRRCWRPRRGRHQFRDPLGHQPVHRQRLRVSPLAEPQLELLVQRAQRPAEERREAESVRRPPGRSDPDSRRLRRAQQGVLLRQLRGGPAAQQLLAHAHGAGSARPARAGSATTSPSAARSKSARSTCCSSRAANGQLSTIDPTIAARARAHQRSPCRTGAVRQLASDPLLNDFVWQSPGNQTENQPVVRLDYNLSQNHRLTGTYNQIFGRARSGSTEQHRSRGSRPRPTTASTCRRRPTRSIALRSTLGTNLVSELRGGLTRGGGSFFGQDETNGVADLHRHQRLCARPRCRQRARRRPDQLACRERADLAQRL